MERSARVVLAIEAPEVLDEVLHFLDRSGAVRVVATADDERQLTDAATQLEPDLVIAEPRFAGQVPAATPCVAIASRESVAALRAAISAGVKAFTVWPEERDMLLGHVRSFSVGAKVLERRATVLAVHASRGGAGCTFVATHLARGLVTPARSVVLVDVDPFGGDVATALGIADGTEGLHPLSELCEVVDELTPGAFSEAVFPHHEGFGVVIAAPPEAAVPDDRSVVRVIDLAAASADDRRPAHGARHRRGDQDLPAGRGRDRRGAVARHRIVPRDGTCARSDRARRGRGANLVRRESRGPR